MKNILLMIALTLILIGCSVEATLKDDSHATQQDAMDVVKSNNQFALDMYKSLDEGNSDNIFISPWSISSALAITYEGARGETATQMKDVLHLTEDETRRNGYARLYNQINEKKEYTLDTANALWADENFRFSKEYFDLIDRYYDGQVRNVDFSNVKTKDTINKYVEDNTRGKIRNIIDNIPPLTKLIITNTIYFKGKWEYEFEKENTQDMDFDIDASTKVKVPMMFLDNKKASMKYYEDDKIQVVDIPYKGKEISMTVLLPKENLESINDYLDYEKLSMIRNSWRMTNPVIYLPKFKFEQKYTLNDNLKELGMPLAFDDTQADFSGMTGQPDLFISKVIHQSFVDANEEGTEAAAATVVMMETKSALITDTPEFKADHPFIFIIQQTDTGNILFMGKVVDPRK